MTDESSGEHSVSDTDSEYDPVESSSSLTESEEEKTPAKRIRHSEQQQATTSNEIPHGEVVSTNDVIHPDEEPSTSSGVSHQPQRVRAYTDVPEALSNPLWLPSNSVAPIIPPFTAQPGIQVETKNLTPIQFFNLFFTEDLLNLIVDQSNRYAQQYITNNPNSYYARPFEWKPLIVEEFKIFLGLTLNMGLTKKNVLRSYWSTNPIHHMPLYSSVMSRTRYTMIMRFLSFTESSMCLPRNDPGYDKLYKIRPLINFFSKKFSQIYTPDKHISIDESLIHFTGRLGIKQYIPNKRSRYGVKLYKLCERATGYTYDFRVYEGKDKKLEPPGCPTYMGSSGKIVWDLVSPLFHQGYHLYVDNFYTSLPLFRHLYLQQTVACGTVRVNRKGFPQRLVNTKLKNGELASMRNEEILALKWKDKRDVYVLSSIHKETSVEIQGRQGLVQKPDCINDYNQFMGGVDFNDQMMQPYRATRRSRFWYKKVSIYLFQLAIYNSFVIYHKSTERSGAFLDFQEAIVTELIYHEGSAPENIYSDAVGRLHGRHFPYVITPSETGRRRQKRCRVCSRTGVRRDTRYCCPQCPSEPGLCIGDCFRRYHTAVQY